MSEGLALGRITQPSGPLHNRTITLGNHYAAARSHTRTTRAKSGGAPPAVTGYLHPFEDGLRDVTLLNEGASPRSLGASEPRYVVHELNARE